ncbi:MAG: carbamoyltransferase HypF, partial [Selenomonadaceae bacterium]|nr:carbamoyltransferase HypF [Selenomonadaceae bacterium]
ISPFTQAGGDKSAREGWRIALAMINDVALARKLNLADDAQLVGQKFLLDKKINCVTSTSAGRLFDAVAAVLGICNVSSYEGEAAMKLQACAERSIRELFGTFATTAELFNGILSRRLDGENIFDTAKFFHASLAEFIAQTCHELSLRTKIKTVALSGGVFQNSLLSSLTAEALRKRGLKILRHSMIPPNDGGICIGQAFSVWSLELGVRSYY